LSGLQRPKARGRGSTAGQRRLCALLHNFVENSKENVNNAAAVLLSLLAVCTLQVFGCQKDAIHADQIFLLLWPFGKLIYAVKYVYHGSK
jgi:hypothetical protein